MGDATGRDQSEVLAEIALATRRAGLRLSAAELAATIEPFQRTQAALARLRAALAASEEPAITFEAAITRRA